MIGQAHERGFFTIVYVFNPDESMAMARAGADCIIAHMGLTVGGSIGSELAMKLEEAPTKVEAIGAAARRVKRDILLVSHGGPIATPDDAAYINERSGAVGFIGASSMERLPVETAITDTVRRFKSIPVRR
jgi:predicted TIM-barrel enzyme